ncbi:MAG TPA: glycosyltransferase family 1 protein [Gemmatimonadales bacterium]|nr:glycosyltransferase family 1 protein [Gemmatimonadales bacterium]
MSAAEAPRPAELVVNVRHLAGRRTGIEVYMEELLRALAQLDALPITAISWSPLGLGLPGVREVVPVQRPEMREGSLRATLWKLWFDQWACLRATPRGEPILYHGMDGFLPYALRRHDRSVLTVHDLGWQVHPELYNPRVRAMYGALFPWAARRADRFIAVSRYTADDLIRRAGISPARIDVVYHGLDPVFTSTPPADPARQERPYFLAVGGVSPRKNTRRLIAAFARWRARGGNRAGYRLLITGTSLDADFIRAESPPDGVTLLGYVDKSELPGLYSGAAAFLYPGVYEGFGLPIIEAMACGTVVVTSGTGAAPEIAAGAAVLVDPFDVTSIEAGIERATSPDTAACMRPMGLERARAFRWDAAAHATLDVYRRVLG